MKGTDVMLLLLHQLSMWPTVTRNPLYFHNNHPFIDINLFKICAAGRTVMIPLFHQPSLDIIAVSGPDLPDPVLGRSLFPALYGPVPLAVCRSAGLASGVVLVALKLPLLAAILLDIYHLGRLDPAP